MVQDTFGFLWIGTWDGLCRWDGFEFKRYFSDPNDQYAIPYSEVNNLAVDKNNDLWIVGKKLSRYDRENFFWLFDLYNSGIIKK
jgi:ligand-binding sensor domain-containing protein